MNLQATAACMLRFKPPTVVRMNHPECFLSAATPKNQAPLEIPGRVYSSDSSRLRKRAIFGETVSDQDEMFGNYSNTAKMWVLVKLLSNSVLDSDLNTTQQHLLYLAKFYQ